MVLQSGKTNHEAPSVGGPHYQICHTSGLRCLEKSVDAVHGNGTAGVSDIGRKAAIGIGAITLTRLAGSGRPDDGMHKVALGDCWRTAEIACVAAAIGRCG